MMDRQEKHLYKYLSYSEGSLATLKSGTMKFTKPIDFNDPFDCFPEFDLDSIKQLSDKNFKLLKKAIDKKGLNSPKINSYKDSSLQKHLENKVKNGLYSEIMVGRIGICCLSRDALNILMWSHYANHHKGFCLEFLIPTGTSKKNLEWLVPLPVTYDENRPLVNINESTERKVESQYLIKSKDWKYEQEERVIDHRRGEGIHNYDRKKILASVIAGMKMSDSDYGALEKIIQDMNDEIGSNIKLYRATDVSGKFALYVPDHPRLSKT